MHLSIVYGVEQALPYLYIALVQAYIVLGERRMKLCVHWNVLEHVEQPIHYVTKSSYFQIEWRRMTEIPTSENEQSGVGRTVYKIRNSRRGQRRFGEVFG